MKKTFTLILTIVIIIIAILMAKYYEYKTQRDKIKEQNLEYEVYFEKEIYGADIATIINKAVDSNEKNKVQKDEQGNYIKNDINSINIEIKTLDLDEEENSILKMEYLYNGGMAKFVELYNVIKFKCTKIDYNSVGKVSYMLFEQITT